MQTGLLEEEIVLEANIIFFRPFSETFIIFCIPYSRCFIKLANFTYQILAFAQEAAVEAGSNERPIEWHFSGSPG